MTEPVKSAFTARSNQDAKDQIARWIRDCSVGISDCEAEALKLAELWAVDTDAIIEGFKEAREAWRAAKPTAKVVPLPQVHRRRLVPDAKASETAKPGDREGMLAAADAIVARKPDAEPAAQPSLGALTVIENAEPLAPTDETAEEKALREMNEKHAVISNLGGKCVIMEWVPSAISEGQKELSYQSFQAFRERYANHHIMVPAGGGHGWQTAPFGPIWLSHPHRRQYEGLDLVPNGPQVLANGYLNLWKGWGIKPRKGSWRLMQRHIAEVLANGSQEFENYIVRSTAWKLQNPGQRPEVVLALIGGKGVGKGVWGHIQMLIWGPHALQIFSTEHLVGKHNQHLQNKLFLYLDEALWGGDRQAERVLKGLVTEKTMLIEPKNINAFPWPNRLATYMSGNDKWIVPASHDERRYAVNKVSERWRQNRDYFAPLFEEVNDGGASAMLYDLLEMDLEGWHPRDNVPQTKALFDQKMLGLTGLQAWWVHLLSTGELPRPFTLKTEEEQKAASRGRKKEDNPRFSLSTHLLENAKGHNQRNRYLTYEDVATYVKEMGCTHKSNGRAWGWVFPPLLEAREAWCQRTGGQWEWLAPSIVDWGEKSN